MKSVHARHNGFVHAVFAVLMLTVIQLCAGCSSGQPMVAATPLGTAVAGTTGAAGTAGVSSAGTDATVTPAGSAGQSGLAGAGVAGASAGRGATPIETTSGAAGVSSEPTSGAAGVSSEPTAAAGGGGGAAPDPSDTPPPPSCSMDVTGSDTCRACTHSGWVAGATEGSTCTYLGIPFAKPPTGNLRFTAPEPLEPWTGVKRATKFGNVCMQSMDLSGGGTQSEDCLFLNVWTPTQAPSAPLPVMVFIYGGGYSGGATNTYPGIGLSQKGPVVVVSMNYRVGVLGFFAHPDLDAQRMEKPSGSDGIRDQQLALRWVRDNVASFGGDPNNVTVFGESAGSGSVNIHVVSPGSRKLAQRFIHESGVSIRGVANGIAPISRDKMYARTKQLAGELCPSAADVIACLRGLSVQQLMGWRSSSDGMPGGVGMSVGWVPVVEGPGGVLPDTPDALLERGDINPGEIIVGTNKNEYGLFQLLGGGVATVSEMRSRVEMEYGAAADEIMSIYAPSASADANQAFITMMTDGMFRCGSREFARLAAASGNKVYLYSFEEGTAWHSEELSYVFGPENNALGFTLAVQSLVDTIQQYWVNFATRGDPNGQGLPVWPVYDAMGDQHMTLKQSPATGSGLQKKACDFWQQYLENSPP